MRFLRILSVCSMLILLASAAFGECTTAPTDGVYTTSAGTLLGGRSSEAWCSGVGPGQIGNTENALSWDGTNLGAQWKVYGMASSGAVETARYFDAYGNGWIDYTTNYTGGYFWLSGTGVWGDGSTDYSGNVTYFNVGARVTYVGGSPVGVTSNILLTGAFSDCEHCSIEYAISNAILIWQTGYPTGMPANYPPFLCSANSGELFDACCIVMKIHCNPVSTDQSTWGAIKSLYR
jgi:hypothetical protein